MAEVRNSSDREQTVSGMFLPAFFLQLTLNEKPLEPIPVYKSFSVPLPVTLPPGRVIRAFVELSSRDFEELKSPGKFTAGFIYSSHEDTENTWTGNLPPATATWRAK